MDFDGVIVNTIKAIVDLYNKDFKYYRNYELINWWDINSWEFRELSCASRKYINTYFNQERFFDILEFMPFALESINKLKQKYDITIVSMGNYPNLKLKEKFIKKYFKDVKFIGIDFKEYNDKSHIDMSDGIVVDDSCNILINSNAKIKICFGDVYLFNQEWKGIRLVNWTDLCNYLLK